MKRFVCLNCGSEFRMSINADPEYYETCEEPALIRRKYVNTEKLNNET